MKSNTLTHDQAYKVYTGNGMLLHVLKISGFGILINLLAFFFYAILFVFINGNISEAISEVNGRFALIIFGVSAFIAVAMIDVDYDKQLPGGKYFRTVKGGYDTYKKMRDSLLIVRMVSLGLIMLWGILCNMVGLLKYPNGVVDVVYIVAPLMISIGFINLINLIDNYEAMRSVSLLVIVFAYLLGLVYSAFDDADVIVALIVAAVSIPFIAVTHKVMLSNYRKNRWDK